MNGYEVEHESDVAAATNRGLIRNGVILAVVAVVAFGGGLFVGASSAGGAIKVPFIADALDAAPAQDANLGDFWKVWNTLNSRFVQTHGSTTIPTTKDKLWGAIAGLTASYKDPYTVFFPPAEAKTFQEAIAGNFGGVGMEIGANKDGVLTVIAPLKETPAEKAGILAGDLIAAIDGTTTEGMSTDEAVRLIRGEVGTKVTFTMVRNGKALTIPVVRATINVPTIDDSLDKTSGVYTIALYTFTANSAQLFDAALARYRASGSHLLLIDLRGNPGGYLEAAVRIASHFLPEGTTIVTEDYEGHQDNMVHKSLGGGGIPAGTKVAILINQGSASASEILSGALQDEHAATLVGTRSFGKGSVQELVDVDGGSLKITVARWVTPAGHWIMGNGITPDIKVERTEADFTAGKDPQRERAIEFLTTGK